MAKRPKVAAPEPEIEDVPFEELAMQIKEAATEAKKIADQMKLKYGFSDLYALSILLTELEGDEQDDFFKDFALSRRVVSDTMGLGADEPIALADVLLVYRGDGEDGEE